MIDILMIIVIFLFGINLAYNLALLRLRYKMKQVERKLEKDGDNIGKFSETIKIDKKGYVTIAKRKNPSWYLRLRNKIK